MLINRNKLKYRQNTGAVIIDKLGKILIVQKNNYDENEWDIPGGGINVTETANEAIARELKEELGYGKFEIVDVSKTIDRYEWSDETIIKTFKKKGVMHRGQERTQFFVKFNGEEKDLKTQANEIRKVKWVLINELEDYLIFPNQFSNIKVLLKEFGI